MTTKTRPAAPPVAYAKAGALALSIALTAGAIAGWVRGDEFWLVATVFASCTLAPAIGLAWVVFVADHTVEVDVHAEESIEQRWFERASSGALLDLVITSGVALTLLSLVDLDLSGRTALLLVVGLAMGDTMLRYALISRRES